MAYSRYETTVRLERFEGIDESQGTHNVGLSMALEAENCRTDQGALRPAPGYTAAYPALNAPIVTLATFYRRNIETESLRRVLVAATETALYCITEIASQWTELMTGLQGGGHWSWVTYEQVTNGETEDVLIMTNATDGMIAIAGSTLTATRKTINMISLDENQQVVQTPIKFDIIERHAERIWGCGVAGEPDNLYYSRPYNPFDFNLVYMDDDGISWTTTPNGNEVLLEESGGIIQVPTWDGDKFVALRRFSNYLIAMKQRSVFYIRGIAAGEFAQYEAYGSDGLFAPNALSVDSSTAYYISDRGLGVYDGDTARLLDMDRLGSVFKNLGDRYAKLACSAVARHILYVAVPRYTGEMQEITEGNLTVLTRVEPERNNVLVEYDIRRKTYMVRTGINADSLLAHGGRLLFTMGDNPSQVYEMTGTTYGEDPVPVKWVSAWQDLGRKDVTKSTFVIYLTGAQCDTSQVITVGIETEKRLKTKKVKLSPKNKKVRFAVGNSGRRFRIVIQAQSTVEWCIMGGLQIEMELDED